MNSKRIVLGIGMVLAILVVFTAPAAADAEVYFEPDPSTVSLAPGENVTIQVMAYVDENENCLRSFQVGVAFDPSVVNITNSTNPAKPGGGNWWNIVHGRSWHPYGDEPPGPEGAWMYTTGMNLPGHPEPITVPLTNFTIEGVSGGTSPLNFTHEMIVEPAGESKLFDCDYLKIEPTTWVNNEIECTGAPGTFSKHFSAGWNLISLPLTPKNNSTSAVLGNDTFAYDAVYSYNAETKLFEDVTDGIMDPGTGYFVNVTTAGTWSYERTSPYNSMNIPLKQGLNMVGWLNCTKQISGNLTAIAGKYNYNARWNAGYEVYEPQAPEIFNDFETMERGGGYWIAAKEDCTLTVSC